MSRRRRRRIASTSGRARRLRRPVARPSRPLRPAPPPSPCRCRRWPRSPEPIGPTRSRSCNEAAARSAARQVNPIRHPEVAGVAGPRRMIGRGGASKRAGGTTGAVALRGPHFVRPPQDDGSDIFTRRQRTPFLRPRASPAAAPACGARRRCAREFRQPVAARSRGRAHRHSASARRARTGSRSRRPR